MNEAPVEQGSLLLALSNAMVKLHKEQFGRGPTEAWSHYAGRNMVVCALTNALLPAERKLVAMGQQGRVRDSRTSFQARPSICCSWPITVSAEPSARTRMPSPAGPGVRRRLAP